MIPLRLYITGFLSYQDPVSLELDGLELACISGSNGAGKSSLLDAITWALFGQARSRDDEALINGSANVKAAEVILDFTYEANTYRVQRGKARGKTTVLEFFILAPDGSWKPLTEKNVRETEKRLSQTLRLDYDTFVNASFFLQGKADQFAQQNSSNRKKVLSNILGLEVWETYRAQAGDQRKRQEAEMKSVDGLLAEIDDELSQGPARKARLEEIENRLALLSSLRQSKESALDALRRLAASLVEQKRLVDMMAARLRDTQARVGRIREQTDGLAATRAALLERVQAADQIERDYAAWQTARRELERWDLAAASFHEIQARRTEPLEKIASVRAQLQEALRGLTNQAQAAQRDLARLSELESEIPAIQAVVAGLQEQAGRRSEIDEHLRELQHQNAEIEAENRRMSADMTRLKERIDKLRQTEGAQCPLCGQPMPPDERQALIASLESEGLQMGNRYRANKKTIEQTAQLLRDDQAELARLGRQEEALRQHTRQLDQKESELARLQSSAKAWLDDGALRMAELEERLAREDFAQVERETLRAIDALAREVGYDVEGHDRARRLELDLRSSEQGLRELEAARAALNPLDQQLASLSEQLASEQAHFEGQSLEFRSADEKYRAELAAMPDLDQAEKEVFAMKSEENRLHMETGMVRQLVVVLDSQRERRARLSSQRQELSRQIGRLKVLERAFSKDGVPALLIEQALPEIESQANDILDRLSAGGMSVRFATQRKLKSKDETRETLEIIISDRNGDREYEMFSGGEAFRVNFAIRLALSRVLAHRAGARLQTLFIDEGFGSQDADGRQRLLEAINLVRSEFERILVITHLEEMKDAFPSRIEVEKTARGSQVRVLR